jgi:hypothetical protein
MVAYVFQTSFVAAFGRSAALETLSSGFDYTTIFDLMTKNGFSMRPVLSLSLAFLVVSLPLQSFLTAGLVSALQIRGPWSGQVFFSGAARHAGGYLILSALGAILVVLIALLAGAAAGVAFLQGENPGDPLVLALLALGLLVSGLVITVADYARIHLVSDPAPGVLASIRSAAAFLRDHARGAVGIWSIMTLASLLPLAGVVLAEGALPGAVGGWLLPLVAVQQAAVFLRSWIRVAAFAAQSCYVRGADGTQVHGEVPPAPSPFLARGI